MAGDDVRHWFDQAYDHMKKGDFASAAKCFEHVIKESGDPNASRIADQRLRWYCIPLEAILNRMQECSTPIDVHLVLEDLFASDSQYLASEQQDIIQIVETELAKLTGVIRIGKKVWVNKDILTDLLGKLAQDILRSTKPLSISPWLGDQIICQQLEDFPDNVTLGVVESGLEGYPIKIIAQEYAVSKAILTAQVNTLADAIRTTGVPVDLGSYSRTIFPEIPVEHAPQSANALKAHLDSRFVEVAVGLEFLVDLLKLSEDHFEAIFQSSPFPLMTETIICARLFPGQPGHTITQHIRGIGDQQLARNSYLRRLEGSYWISKTLESSYYSSAENYLLNGNTPKSSQAVLDNILSDKEINHQNRNRLQNLLEAYFKTSKNVILIGNQFWLHLAAVKQAIEKAYQQLLSSSKPLTSNTLLKDNIDLGKTEIAPGLSTVFESLLEKDQRFAYKSGKIPRLWYALDPSCKDNQEAYFVIERAHTWLSLEEITNRISSEYGITSPTINLKSDDRLKSFPPDCWGLIDWVSINDAAYKYLFGSRQALHEVVIIGLICQRAGIVEGNAIFTPEQDPRFAQDSLNRWFCRHVLTAAELDMLHEELIKYGGSGRKLDILTREVLHLHPDSTDAQGRLEADERFICLDGLWFARQAAFYSLTPADVEKIYGILAAQADYRTAIPLKELVNQAIGHDGRLTDASVWLHKDERFKEVHEAFWALSSSPVPDFDRSGIGGVAVHRPSDDGGAEGGGSDSKEGKLTPRKGRSTTAKVPQEPQKKVYITLSHLDILHGNLRIAGILKKWIPTGVDNIHCVDEEDYEFIAYIDESGSILNIREWLEYRGLTYGDKISIQPALQVEGLFIRRYGDRDEQVYQEAIDHQEIEKLIAEARRVNKDFHDLMIEVMEEYNRPLHREDIYQLVNYQRTASRNTISEILSLPDCPFEELRYFIPVGAGSWKFDRKRKEAYDMKMQELLTENGDLRSQLVNLQAQLESPKGSPDRNLILSEQIEQFQNMIAETNDKVERLQKDKNSVELINSELQKELEVLRKQIAKLQADIAEAQTASQEIQNQAEQEKTQLQERINTLANQVDSLQNQAKEIQERAAFEIKEDQGKLDTQTKVLEQQSVINSSLEAELETAKANKESIQKEIDQLRGESTAKAGKLEADLATAQDNNESLHREIEQLRGESVAKDNKLDAVLAAAKSKVESLQREIEQLMHEKADIAGKLEAELTSAYEKEKSLQREIDQLKQESTIRISQLEAELAVAQTKMAEAQEMASPPSPSKFKKFFQGISKMLFGKKS